MHGSEYLAHALEAERSAQSSHTSDERAAYLRMAAVWRGLYETTSTRKAVEGEANEAFGLATFSSQTFRPETFSPETFSPETGAEATPLRATAKSQ